MQLEYINVSNEQVTLVLSNGKYLIKGNIRKYLNTLCLGYGSSLQGSINSFNYYVKAVQKTPIAVSNDDKLLLFPLVSLCSRDNIILNYYEIKNYVKYSSYQTKVLFNSNNYIIIDYDIRTIKQQFKRVKYYLELRGKRTYLTQLLCYNTWGECNG